MIVPVYNKEKTLARCLDSLLQQDYKNIEIIVVDDKSTDDSKKVIEYYQKKYPAKIKASFNKKNSYIGKTRNMGLSLATGDYIGFVDSDDYVKKDMYSTYIAFMEEHDLDIVSGYYEKVGKEEGLFKNTYFPLSNIKKRPHLLLEFDCGPCNKLFRKSLIDEHEIRFLENTKYEDVPFVLKALYYAKRVGHLKKSYYYYYIHDESETTVMDEHVFDIFKILDEVRTTYHDFDNQEVLEAFVIREVGRYLLLQKYQKNKKIRSRFIEEGYLYLEKMNPKWRQNKIYKQEKFIKKMIQNHKMWLKLYHALG